ncbi:MAG: VOC family protein [Planctomycetota bacterium]
MSIATTRPAAANALGLRHLDHLNLSVADLARTRAWYGRVFGFEVVEEGTSDDGSPWAILRGGDALLCCYERAGAELPTNAARRARGEHGINHFGLRITDRAAWEAAVARERLTLHWGSPLRYPHGTSWYVEDPTGYSIEVALWDGDTVAF